MFETVYCAKESFENEVEATDRLGWVNGLVLREFCNYREHQPGTRANSDWRPDVNGT